MDEYLFITMAKLKADRWRLEQEQRQQLTLEPREDRRSTVSEQVPRSRDAWISRWSWREQS